MSNTVSCEGNSVNNRNDCRDKFEIEYTVVHQKLFYITGMCKHDKFEIEYTVVHQKLFYITGMCMFFM